MAMNFIKMHGLGNDFLVLDRRDMEGEFMPRPDQIIALADRRGGIGFDQLIVIDRPDNAHKERVAANLRFYNSDGGEAGACGNGTRAIAGFLMQELNQPRISFSTRHIILDAWVHDPAQSIVAVDMGEPVRKWQDISAGKHGQCEDVDLDHVKLPIPDEFADYQDLQEGAVVTGFGNPHAVFVLQQDSALEHTEQIMRFCESMMKDPRFKNLFPDGVNIGFLSKADDNRLRLRVHERGAGLTLACGSGSAAAMVAAVQRGLATRSDKLSIDILVDGSFHFAKTGHSPDQWLKGTWRASDNHVILAGPWQVVYHGTL